MLIVGGEKKGISKDILEYSDEVIRIPMTGFVPSFNLQAPLSAVAIEAPETEEFSEQRARINTDHQNNSREHSD